MKTGNAPKVIVGFVLCAALVTLNVFALRKRQPLKVPTPEVEKRFVNPTFKANAERIQREVNTLKKETVEQTLDQLAVPDMYFWPGPGDEEPLVRYVFPFPPRLGQRAGQSHLNSHKSW